MTDSERWALDSLAAIAGAALDLAESIVGLPWMIDGVTGIEWNAIQYLAWTTRTDPALARTVAGLPWLLDEITEEEGAALYVLGNICSEGPRPCREDSSLSLACRRRYTA